MVLVISKYTSKANDILNRILSLIKEATNIEKIEKL